MGNGIPSFVIIDTDGTTITKDGREAVMSDPDGAEFPWHPKPVKDAANPSGIDETPSLLVFMETQSKEEQSRITADMTAVAQRYIDEAKTAKSDSKYLFFAATNTNGPVPRIRELTKQEALPPTAHEHPLEEKPPSGGWCCDGCGSDPDATAKRFRCAKGCDFAYCEMSGEVNVNNLKKFIADFEGSALERKQCGA